jgi:DNA-directed RNA polymerase specialized sigma24 family protein
MSARAFRGPVQEGVALRAAALAADGTGAQLARFGEAVERFDAAGAQLWAARTRVEHGTALAAAGEASEGPLWRALDWADEAGASAVRAAAAAALVAAGHDPGPPSRKATHALTPAERRVVEFAATGLEAREIAQRLMLTPATVRRRLASAQAKLEAG